MSVGESRVATDPRISRRRRAIARTRRRRWFTIASAGAVVLVGTWAVLWSPLLHVRDVKVVGGAHTTWQEVARAAGLEGDENLLFLSTSEVARRVETLPWVRDAEVERMLPGTVRVRLVERKPALLVTTEDGVVTVDARGRVLARGRAAQGLAVLGGRPGGGLGAGDRVQDPALLGAIRAYRSMPGRLGRDVVALFAPTEERITFSLADGTVIRYGAAERTAAKNEVLRALLGRLAGDDIVYIDVRVPTSPAVAPVAAPPPPAPVASAPTAPSEEEGTEREDADRPRDADRPKGDGTRDEG